METAGAKAHQKHQSPYSLVRALTLSPISSIGILDEFSFKQWVLGLK